MPERTLSSITYRYGFNGKEKDEDEEWGDLTHYDYGFRIYNPGIGKFLSVDPLTKQYAMLTPYQFASNTPIQGIDRDGLEVFHYTRREDDNGNTTLQLFNITDHVIGKKKVGYNWHGNSGSPIYEEIIYNTKQKHVVHYSYHAGLGGESPYAGATRTKENEYQSYEEALAAPDSEFEFTTGEKIATWIEAGTSVPGGTIKPRKGPGGVRPVGGNLGSGGNIVKTLRRGGLFGRTINLKVGNAKKGLEHILRRH